MDVKTGEKQEWRAPLHTYCEEVVVIQKKTNKHDRKEEEAEDDVWVLGSMFDAVKNKACVGIFDGLDLSKGKSEKRIEPFEPSIQDVIGVRCFLWTSGTPFNVRYKI